MRDGGDVADSCSVMGLGLDTRTWRGGKSIIKGTHNKAFENMQEEENCNSDAKG